MARTALGASVAATAIAIAWLSLEDPRALGESVAVALLAIVPALFPGRRTRLLALVPCTVGAAWLAFGAQPWELAPFRDEPVLAPMLHDVGAGVVDFYEVFLPFVPERNPEMHMLVLCAIFGFTLAAALLVAARRPIAAAAVTVAGVGWPATLSGGSAIAFGTLALAAALAIPLVLRASSIRTLAAGTAIGLLVVLVAASASSATTLGRTAALDWESWDLRGPPREASAVKFVWESDYDGISFPPTKTVVLRVEGPESPHYWRTTTLDLFADDHWIADPYWVEQIARDSRELSLSELLPRRAADRRTWIEQRVRIEALVDDYLAAAGTPVALDARRVGTVFLLSGGVLRARFPARSGVSYTVWSYAPDPAPRALAAAPVHTPAAAERYLEVDGRTLPSFGVRNRDQRVRAFLRDPAFAGHSWQRAMYDVAHRVAGDAETPYAAVLALESWLRQTGGFRYEESPPRVHGPPLLTFVTRTKAGYCQHFAGAMTLMLRLLGVPSRVAVGFTSGTNDDGTWVVTDHDAHAWVEAWFPGQGWIPFDPTPGRGNLGGDYSFASSSPQAVAALERGELSGEAPNRRTSLPDTSDLLPTTATSDEGQAPLLLGVVFGFAAAWVVLVGLGKLVARRARYLSRDPRRVATATRRELEGFLRDQGAEVPPGATLATLQRAVREEFGLDGGAFASAMARARYGPPETAEQGVSAARHELRDLLRAARGDLSIWARARGFASLRSIRSPGA